MPYYTEKGQKKKQKQDETKIKQSQRSCISVKVVKNISPIKNFIKFLHNYYK